MKNFILSVFLLLTCLVGKAQDFQGEARAVVDSLLRIWENDTANVLGIPENDKFYFARLEDSLTQAFMLDHINAKLARSEYSWPFWYFQQLATDSTLKSGLGYPSPTQQYLMESKYGVRMNGLSNGCLWQHAFVIHDSLMMAAIRKRYGFDFFHRVRSEADSLDKRGMGLCFPYINSPTKTDSVLRKAFHHFIASTDTLDDSGKHRYLEVYFKNGKAIHAAILKDAGYAYFPEHIPHDEGPYVHEIVQTLPWTPPTFLGRPVDQTVLWNVAKGEFRWR